MSHEAIDLIRYHHRQRNYAMEQRKRADLALGSFLRMVLGWSLDLPKSEQEAIRKQAKELVKIGEKIEKGKPVEVIEGFEEWHPIIAASIKARAPFDDIEKTSTKEMERLAKSLPAWDGFAKDVRGFGAVSLAVIVGEAGDLSKYPKKGHLWKRMGLAVMDGVRQGGLSKNAGADAWIAHGYNRVRRSKMFVIGDCMVKSGAYYRDIYLARKAYERDRAEIEGLIVAPAAKVPAKRKSEFISDGHIHRRAQRYMEKRLLKDLWQVWRLTEGQVADADKANIALPTVNPIERKAVYKTPKVARNPLPTVQPLRASSP